MTADLRVTGLTVEYVAGGHATRPLDGFDLHVAAGSAALLMGPSGSGKTTLLSCLAGILSPNAGTISFGDTQISGLVGKDLIAYRRSTVGVVFQAFNLVPSLSAVENVMAPLLAAGVRTRAASAKATSLLEQVGLAERLRHRPGELSGGQQQRVAIARALVHDPPLLLADEPTAHLDRVQVEGVLQLLATLVSGDRVVVVATHDDRLFSLSQHVVDLGHRPPPAPVGQPPVVTSAPPPSPAPDPPVARAPPTVPGPPVVSAPPAVPEPPASEPPVATAPPPAAEPPVVSAPPSAPELPAPAPDEGEGDPLSSDDFR